MPDIISPTQGAFIPGLLITDNILVACESLHAIKNKKEGKEGWCALKLYMHKAYDRVEWVFMEAILLKLCFHSDWVKLVMLWVTYVEYRARFNGHEMNIIVPWRGLR